MELRLGFGIGHNTVNLPGPHSRLHVVPRDASLDRLLSQGASGGLREHLTFQFNSTTATGIQNVSPRLRRRDASRFRGVPRKCIGGVAVR
jgi:hypothetical protein